MARLLTDDELRDLARSPRQRVGDAVAAADWSAAQATWSEVRTLYYDFLLLYRRWVASLQEFVLNSAGREALADASRLDAVVSAMLARGISAADVTAASDSAPDRVMEALQRRDGAAAMAAFDATERGIRQAHDYLRDWISSLLSWVYRKRGLGALRDALRHSSELFWMPWMMEDITHPPERRVREFARMLQSNFATVRVEEDDEKFTIIQDPCGSCTRQHMDGVYEGPNALAVVTEPDPLSFMQGNVTIYRTHIPVMHFMMPIERIGAPWPVILCPSAKGGVCRVLLYKDPRQAAAEHYRLVGLEPPDKQTAPIAPAGGPLG